MLDGFEEAFGDLATRFIANTRMDDADFLAGYDPRKSSGFPFLDTLGIEYYHQKYFERRIEQYTRDILINGVLTRALKLLGYTIESDNSRQPDDRVGPFLSNSEFEAEVSYEFCASIDGRSFACRYTDLDDEAAEEILKELGADELYVINMVKWDVVDITGEDVSTTKTGNGDVVRCPLFHFFERHIGKEEYWHYIKRLATIIEGTHRLIGAESIRRLNSYHLGTFRMSVENEIVARIDAMRKGYERAHDPAWEDFEDRILGLFDYKVMDEESLGKYPNLGERSRDLLFESGALWRFGSDLRLWRYVLGRSNVAKSLFTSEYLFTEFDGDACFDYTAVISGYLKSIEQLLYEILRITEGGVTLRNRGFRKSWCPERIRDKEYVVPDADNLQYVDSTLGSLIKALTPTSNRKKVFLFSDNSDWVKTVTDCLKCYKDECRNNHFHKDVMTDWWRVQQVRDNTLFLYIVLLGGCRMSGSVDRDMAAFDVVSDLRLERMHYLASTDSGATFVTVHDDDGSDIAKRIKTIEATSSLAEFDEDGFVNEITLKLARKDGEGEKMLGIKRGMLAHEHVYLVVGNGELEELI